MPLRQQSALRNPTRSSARLAGAIAGTIGNLPESAARSVRRRLASQEGDSAAADQRMGDSLGSLVNTAANPATVTSSSAPGLPAGTDTAASVPRDADQAQLDAHARQLRQANEDLARRLEQLQQTLMEHQQRTSSTLPMPANPQHERTGAAPQSASPDFSPPPRPPVVWRDGPFAFTRGLIESMLALSVATMGNRMSAVLGQPNHSFRVKLQDGDNVLTQASAPYHFHMANYLRTMLTPTPDAWPAFANVLVSAVRQHQEVFGGHAVNELHEGLHLFSQDLADLRAQTAHPDAPCADSRVIQLALQCLRDGDPMSFFRSADAEISRVKLDMLRAQPRPCPDRAGRGRWAVDNNDRTGHGGAPANLSQHTIVDTYGNGAQAIFIRKGVRGPDGQYAAGLRCFKCGSKQHRMDNCRATADIIDKWVKNAEPAP